MGMGTFKSLVLMRLADLAKAICLLRPGAKVSRSLFGFTTTKEDGESPEYPEIRRIEHFVWLVRRAGSWEDGTEFRLGNDYICTQRVARRLLITIAKWPVPSSK